MNYEKAYNEALERARKLYKDAITLQLEQDIKDYEYIFPELKESEDERIRKELLESFKYQQRESRTDKEWLNGIKLSEVVAWLEKQKSVRETVERCKNSWYNEGKIAGMAEGLTNDEKYQQGWHDALEKQGEQKVPINDFKAKNWYVSEVDGKIHDMTYNPADKVEPKFKVRDWIINDQGSAFQIAYIDEENCRYVFEIGGYTKEEMNYENIAFANNHYRKWTIEDAKDGDVLYSLDSKQPFVFKHRKPNEQAVVYCGINTYGKFFIGNTKDCVITTDKYIPATKEQRDTLFKKMKEAGYQWDAEKKELKLLISNGGDFESPTWSEDDERIVTALMEGFRYHQLFNPRFGEVPNTEIISWIKSLKERLS